MTAINRAERCLSLDDKYLYRQKLLVEQRNMMRDLSFISYNAKRFNAEARFIEAFHRKWPTKVNVTRHARLMVEIIIISEIQWNRIQHIALLIETLLLLLRFVDDTNINYYRLLANSLTSFLAKPYIDVKYTEKILNGLKRMIL